MEKKYELVKEDSIKIESVTLSTELKLLKTLA